MAETDTLTVATANALNTIKIVNGNNLDTYLVYIVNSSSALEAYSVKVVNGSTLDDYT